MEFLLRHIWKRQEEHASICIINTLFCFWKNKKSETELILFRNLNIYKFWDLNFFFSFGVVVLFLSQSSLPTLPFTVTLSISLFSCLYDVILFSIKQMAFVSFFFIPGFYNFIFYVCSSIYPPQAITLQVPCQHKVITCFYRLLDNYSWHYSVRSNINV